MPHNRLGVAELQRHSQKIAYQHLCYTFGATLKIYPGFDHGMCSTHKDQINADLLAFLKT
jgi:hypothetical protein